MASFFNLTNNILECRIGIDLERFHGILSPLISILKGSIIFLSAISSTSF